MSEGFNPISDWIPIFVTGTAYTTSVVQVLDAGTPVVSQVIPVGVAWSPETLLAGVPRNPVSNLTIGCAGMWVRVQLTGSGTENVTFEVFPRDPYDARAAVGDAPASLFAGAFQVVDPELGVVYAKGATTPYNQAFNVRVEDVGMGCNLKFTRAAGTGNMNVAAWFKRYRYYS